MAIVANLDIVMGTQTQKAERGLRKTRNLTKTLTKTVTNLAAAFLSFRAGQAAIDGINRSFETLDRLGKRARSLNLPTEELQSFALSAELAGGNSEAIGKALSVLQRRASEARVGLSTALRPLEQLDIDVEAFNKLGTSDQYKLVADRIGQVADQTDRARIAQELFGRAGSELLPLLLEGGNAIDQSREFLDRYNLALSKTDVAKVEQANDAWTRLRRVQEGITNQLAVSLAPAVERVAVLFTVGFNKARDIIGAISQFLGTSAGQTAKWVIATLAINAAIGVLLPLLVSAVKLVTSFAKAQAIAIALTGPKGWAKLAASAALAAVAIKGIDLAMGDVSSQIETLPEFNIAEDIEDAASALDTQLANGIDKAGEAVEDLNAKAESLTDSLRTPFEDLISQLAEIKTLSKGGFIDPSIARRGIDRALKEFQDSLNSNEYTIDANVEAVVQGSQQEFALRYGQEVRTTQQLHERSIQAEEAANETLRDILDELRTRDQPQPANLG